MRPSAVRALDVVGGQRELEVCGIALDHAQRNVDLLELDAREAVLADLGQARDPHGPELPANAAFAQPRDVRIAGACAR